MSRLPREDFPALGAVSSAALDPDWLVELAINCLWTPADDREDLADQILDRVVSPATDVDRIESRKQRTTQQQSSDGIGYICEVARLQSATPDRIRIEPCDGLRDQGDYSMALVLALAVCSEDPAGNRVEAILLVERA